MPLKVSIGYMAKSHPSDLLLENIIQQGDDVDLMDYHFCIH